MFKKEILKRGNTEVISVKNQDKSFCIDIIPSCGAYINSLVLKNTEIIDGNKNDNDLSDNPAFKSTLLAPFPNRIKDGTYSFNGHAYQLSINEGPRNNALHGFIFNAPFDLVKENLQGSFAALEFRHDYNGGLSGYPFKFTSIVSYKISVEGGFSSAMQFTNLENHAIPFGFGWHPYFKFEKPVDELFLKTSALKKFVVDDQMIPTGEVFETNEYAYRKSLSGIDMDGCFAISETGDIISTELSDSAGTTLKLWQETGKKKLNYIQIYIPPHRNSIAIEPQTCCINAFNNRYGYFELDPNETISAAFGVDLIKE